MNMQEESFEIKPISYQIRIIEECDLDSLMLVKSDASVHTDRLKPVSYTHLTLPTI